MYYIICMTSILVMSERNYMNMINILGIVYEINNLFL